MASPRVVTIVAGIVSAGLANGRSRQPRISATNE